MLVANAPTLLDFFNFTFGGLEGIANCYVHRWIIVSYGNRAAFYGHLNAGSEHLAFVFVVVGTFEYYTCTHN